MSVLAVYLTLLPITKLLLLTIVYPNTPTKMDTTYRTSMLVLNMDANYIFGKLHGKINNDSIAGESQNI